MTENMLFKSGDTTGESEKDTGFKTYGGVGKFNARNRARAAARRPAKKTSAASRRRGRR